MNKQSSIGFNVNNLLNGQSQNAIKRPLFTLKEIHIDNIVPSDRNEYSIRNIEELAGDIESIGLLHNLVVEPQNEDGKHILISGERRYRACKLLVEGGNEDYTYLPCKVEKPDGSLLTELKLILANSTARQLTDYEKTYQAGRLKEILTELKADGHAIKGRVREIVADTLKVSSAQIGRMESINQNLAPKHKAAFKAGKIGISKAYNLSTSKKIPTKEQSQEPPAVVTTITSMDHPEITTDTAKSYTAALFPASELLPDTAKTLYILKFSGNPTNDTGTRYSGVTKQKAFDIILDEYNKGSILETIDEG